MTPELGPVTPASTAGVRGISGLPRGVEKPAAAVLLVVFLLVPLLPGKFWTNVMTEALILGLFAMSFNLLYGYMGQISFGHAAFFGVGAYATAMTFTALKAPDGSIALGQFLIALVAAPPIAALAALVVGFFCVRLTGIYFAILSLAFGELLYYIVFSWYSFTKGDDGIQGLLPPAVLQDAIAYHYFTLAVVTVAVLVMWRIVESPFGYAMRTLRDNARRAAYLGINVRLYMLANFVLAGTFAGVAGALWGPFQRSVAPPLLGWQESGIAVFMTLIGGAAQFVGPMLGSVIYILLQAVVTLYTTYWPLTIGIIILLIVMFAPGGILGVLARRLKPRADAAEASERQA